MFSRFGGFHLSPSRVMPHSTLERRPVRRLQRQSIFQPPALVHYGQHAISAKVIKSRVA